MTFNEYKKRFEKEMSKSGMYEQSVNEDELRRMFLSHKVILEWQGEQQREQKRKDKARYDKQWEIEEERARRGKG